MNDLIHPPTANRVRRALQGAAGGLHTPRPGPDVTRERSRRRTTRRQMLNTGVAGVALIAGSIGVVQILDREPGIRFSDVAAPPQTAEMTFSWTDAEAVMSFPTDIAKSDDGVLYALSTAPGVIRPDEADDPTPQAIYRSTDGLNWETTTYDPGLHLSALSVGDDGLLYGLSTSPAVAGAVAMSVATSADGGATWERTELAGALDVPTVNEGFTVQGPDVSLEMAQHGNVRLAVMRTDYYVDSSKMLTAEDGDAYTTPTEAGLAVHQWSQETGGETLRTIPWDDVGPSGLSDLGATSVYVSEDGGDWKAVDPNVAIETGSVSATPAGFVAAVIEDVVPGPGMPMPAVRLARSVDGSSWTVDAQPLGNFHLNAIGQVGDQMVIVGTPGDVSEERSWIQTSADGGITWTETAVDDLLVTEQGPHTIVSSADFGPLGAAMVVDQGNDDASLLFTSDGVSWTQIAATEVLPTALRWNWATVGVDGIVAGVALDGMPPVENRTVVGTPTR